VRRRRKLEKPNTWFGFLHASVAEDREERGDPPELTEDEILAWADAYHARTGQWPTWRLGRVPQAPGETWLAVEAALAIGLRGLPGRSSIPRLLDEHRGRYNRRDPRFTVKQILAWADAYHARMGEWPIQNSGDIPELEGINWSSVDNALRHGRGGLRPGSSLSRLLAAQRGVVHRLDEPLTEGQILAWADERYERTGCWPSCDRVTVAGAAPGETWEKVDNALSRGSRGLPGGSSLPRLLAEHRGVRNKADLPPLTAKRILAWADAHNSRTGGWPNPGSGPIPEAPGETWNAVESALKAGIRGLAGGSSLIQLLVKRRGIRNPTHPPPLSIRRILAWADAFHARAGDGRPAARVPSPRRPGRPGWRFPRPCEWVCADCPADRRSVGSSPTNAECVTRRTSRR